MGVFLAKSRLDAGGFGAVSGHWARGRGLEGFGIASSSERLFVRVADGGERVGVWIDAKRYPLRETCMGWSGMM